MWTLCLASSSMTAEKSPLERHAYSALESAAFTLLGTTLMPARICCRTAAASSESASLVSEESDVSWFCFAWATASWWISPCVFLAASTARAWAPSSSPSMDDRHSSMTSSTAASATEGAADADTLNSTERRSPNRRPSLSTSDQKLRYMPGAVGALRVMDNSSCESPGTAGTASSRPANVDQMSMHCSLQPASHPVGVETSHVFVKDWPGAMTCPGSMVTCWSNFITGSLPEVSASPLGALTSSVTKMSAQMRGPKRRPLRVCRRQKLR
mmetsp:Transcript_54468/g.80853  ORF Transcript_54468/g.80853 Transcript_54468/m.80853 type:complete len:270 (-) Transcript_54468:1893-2702(-)